MKWRCKLIISGIYKITNLITGKYYIGSSKNIIKRWKRHKKDLKMQRHNNDYLQRSWNLHGSDAFNFEVIEQIEPAVLLEREQFYLDNLDFEMAYNIGKNAAGGDNITNHPRRDEIIAQLSQYLRDYHDSLTLEQKQELSRNSTGEKNPNFGNRWNDEQRERASGMMKERIATEGHPFEGKTFEEVMGEEAATVRRKELSEVASQRTGEKNPFYGRHHTEETKEVLRLPRLGKYNGEQNKPIVVDCIYYKSLGDAEKALGIPLTTVRWRVRSQNSRFSNYRYATEQETKEIIEIDHSAALEVNKN